MPTNKKTGSQVWHTLLIPTFRRFKEEDYKLEASLRDIANSRNIRQV